LSYEDLLPHTIEMDMGEGVRVRVLDLATIIALKEELAGEKTSPFCRFCGARWSKSSADPGNAIST
jgi:hypothetical protein